MPYIIFTLLVLEELTMSAVNFNMRLEEDLRDNANHIFEEYGLTMPQAFKLFLNQVVKTRTVPLAFDYAERTNSDP